MKYGLFIQGSKKSIGNPLVFGKFQVRYVDGKFQGFLRLFTFATFC
jgi:hypothetical protein